LLEQLASLGFRCIYYIIFLWLFVILFNSLEMILLYLSIYSFSLIYLRKGSLPSPRMAHCVFVLIGEVVTNTHKTLNLRKKPEDYEPGFYPLGTAFATRSNSRQYLLTAFHTIQENVDCSRWYVTTNVGRCNDGTWDFNSTFEKVSVVDYDTIMDVALLKIDSKYHIPIESTVEICPIAKLPKQSDEASLKTYYVPVEDMTPQLEVPLCPSPSDWKRVYAISSKYLFLPGGLCKGSSGGLVIDKAGLAVAMHIESISSSKSSTDILKEYRDSSSRGKKNSHDKALSESSTSLANTHMSSQKCIILSSQELSQLISKIV
jgi:hypothetical protein